MTDPISALIAAGAVLIATQGAAYDPCSLYEEGQYDWRIEASGGRLTLTAEDVPGFDVIGTVEGVDTTGEFDVQLVSEGGRREIRITPPDVLFDGIPARSEWYDIDLIITNGGAELIVPGPPWPSYRLSENDLYLLDQRAVLAGEAGIGLVLRHLGRDIARGSIKSFLLDAGMEEWDETSRTLLNAGCTL